ncbi:hypothetical protein IFM89_021246 [Coptis chinensis]|uniref:BIG2 domain-containing protein n=1 Tax=Coptis chinensis TaxID=261450 RepID=A0A835IZV1_9MAGN|nr:hypothetical protein IFM89_021246 [Coptis chinensis]
MILSTSFPLILLIFIPISLSLTTTGPHIADVNISLPPKTTYPIQYRLLGSDGCFTWSWDHHDILQLEPEFNSTSLCSTSARLKSIGDFDGRKETAIYASDIKSGVVIRCKVFIDEIKRVQIFHSSVKLDLDGLATLRVRAFDYQENVFSSLVGMRFKWGLMPGEDGGVHRLVHVPLKESPLSDCSGFCGDLDIQISLEDSGVFSDLFAVKGTEIGHEIVSVNLIESGYEHLADKIVLTVAEAMSIEPPSPLYVLTGAYVQYSLKVLRQNTPQAIPLPSPHHRWSVVNSSVAQVDSQLGVAHALNLGVTTITVEDTRVAGHVQMSSLHVVIPDTLRLTAFGDPIEGITSTPSSVRWYVVAGQQYVIHLKVFSGGSDGHEVYITESDDVKLQYDESAHWVTSLVPAKVAGRHCWQGSRILKAVSHGFGRLSASLVYHGGFSETIEVMKIVQEVMVCDPVKFDMASINDSSPKIIHLPWVAGVYQELALKATGGCMETSTSYKWYSSDMTTVSVSASGFVQAKKPGQVTIKVVSMYDEMNYDQVDVKVSIPSEMVMLQKLPVETMVGTYLQAAVTLRASDGSYFYSCDSFSSMVRWTCGSESFRISNTTGQGSSLIKQPDVDDFKSSYSPPCAWTNLYAFSAGRALLHATLQKELLSSGYPSDGPKNELYLVPGTKLDIALVGGPELWDQAVKFVETVDIFEEGMLHMDGLLVDRESSIKGGLYRLSCITVGNFELVFSHGNLVGDDHPLPAVEKVKLSLACTIPSSITLLANEPAAVGIHKSGKVFANSSSLCLNWELSSCNGLAHWEVYCPSVRATVTGFCDTIVNNLLEKASLMLEMSEKVLTDAIRLQASLSITGGTCFLDAVVNDTSVVEVMRPSPSLECWHLTIAPRGLGSALVTANDIGLTPPLAASAVVEVAEVDWIKIISQEELSIMDGSEKALHFSAGVHDGSVFDFSQTVRAIVYGSVDTVICEAEAQVRVAIPSSMILSVQSEQLSVGHKMPVFPSLAEEKGVDFINTVYGRKGTIVYSLLRTCCGKNKEIQLDPISIDGGRIKTLESNNLGCILAKDRATGRTEIASCVRVAKERCYCGVELRESGLDDPVLGRWLSSNQSVLSVNMVSGKARAVGEGASQVIFEGPRLRLQTTATVQSVDMVVVDSPLETLTNVPFPTKGYCFAVRFRHKLEEIGNSEGIFFLLLTKFPTRMNICNMVITIAKEKELIHLSLTPDSNTSVITVVGNTGRVKGVEDFTTQPKPGSDVEVHWKERDLLMVSPIHRKDFGIGGQAEYEVKALRAVRFKDKIIFVLPAAGQRVELDINYDPGFEPSSSAYYGYLAAACVSFAALIVTLVLANRFIVTSTSIPATPSIAGPVTPDPTISPTYNTEQSPRTPQPFIQYVRRTIDETPYYKP